MNDSIKKAFPRWMQEFSRFQTLKSQFYLYANIYDCYYFPFNHHQVDKTEDLQWGKFEELSQLLRVYLEHEGYQTICYYDIIDGLQVYSPDEKINRDSIIKMITDDNPHARGGLSGINIGSVDKNLDNALQFFRYLVRYSQFPVAGIIHFASRFSSSPNRLAEEERTYFMRLIKAAQEARRFPDQSGRRSMLILLCDKLNDIPSWVLLENPLTKGIEISKPNKEERSRFFQVQSRLFYQEGAELDPQEAPKLFPDLTDGLSNRELENLMTISKNESIHVNNIRQIVDLFKYGTKENFWEDLEWEKVENAEELLGQRVKGQPQAIKRCADIIKRAKLGLNSIDHSGTKSRPKGIVFLAGPTGVGKTELAKSMAELIYNSEDAIIRFDMSEYNDSNSDVKLIGSPPGYVGYEEGGQLTSQIKSRPFSIVLFDEIEKAHPKVFDKFLQILDDGRLTDGKGETVYFSESLIIFTSNLGMVREVRTDNGVENVVNVNIEDPYDKMCEAIDREIKIFFNSKLKRPEILSRFGDNFVIFDFIREPVDREILLKGLNTIKRNLIKQKGWDFQFDDEFIEKFREHHVKKKLIHGGRGINNAIESQVKNGITAFAFSQRDQENLKFRAVVDDDEEHTVRFE